MAFQEEKSASLIIPGTNGQLEELTRDFKRLQQQKHRKIGGVEGRVLMNLGMVGGDHNLQHKNGQISPIAKDPNKLYLMFDMIGPRMGKLLGRLATIAPVFKAQPTKKDASSFAKAEVVDQLIKALDKKLIQPSKTWEILWWMAVGGVAFEHVPWVPNASMESVPQMGPDGEVMFKNAVTGESMPEEAMNQMIQGGMFPQDVFDVHEEVGIIGDVGSEILGPLNVFIDHSVKSIAELAPDQRVYIAKIRTLGWIEENFGKKVEPMQNFQIVQTRFHQAESLGEGTFLRDLIPLIQGTAGEDDLPAALVVEAYTPVSKKNPSGRYDCFTPGGEIIHSAANPYGEIPLVDFHWKPVTTTFWTGDYVSSLIPPQKFINKRVSQLGEQSNASVYSTLLLGGSLKASDVPADYPGVMENALTENGTALAQRLTPPELPTWFLESINTVVRMFNDIAGGSDLFEENSFPGQLRGPMAVPLLQEILDTEWGPLYEHIGERMALVKQMRLNRVKQFYPPQRTLHYTNRDLKDEVLDFHTDEIMKSGVDFKITIERGELIPEFRALREARVRERLNGPLAILYMDERTGRLDKSKIASDLQFGDVGREGREAQYRKLGAQIVEMLWTAQPMPPVLPFYDHAAMMDELEAAMATTEFLRASPQIQQAFTQRWEQHRQFLMLEAQAQQQAMMSAQAHSAVAQSTQQAAAMAAADAVDEANAQKKAQNKQPTGAIVAGANAAQDRRPKPPQGPPQR